MDKLVSDRAQSKISNKVVDILRNYHINDWQSLPKMQHQNPMEGWYQTVKRYTNTIMERTNAPPNTWFLCL